MKIFKPMICPVCNDFYFSDLQEGDSIKDLQCLKCGWKYDLGQFDNPDEKNGTNVLSLNEYKEWFRKKIESNPNYDYAEETAPDAVPHKCPICGKYEFKDEWSYEICPFCGWEDDGSEEEQGSNIIGSNGLCFSDYKKRYERYIIDDPNYKWEKNGCP